MRNQLSPKLQIEVTQHNESCLVCQRRLEELTDDRTLSDLRALIDKYPASTFTQEPHFNTLKKRLAEEVGPEGVDGTEGRGRGTGGVQNPPGPEENRDGPNAKWTDPGVAGVVDSIPESTSPGVDTLQVSLSKTLKPSQVSGEHGLETDRGGSGPSSFPTIDGYLIDKRIGQGGFSCVYLGWDKSLNRNVAIKVLNRSRLDPANRRRFLREAQATTAVRSPHTVQVLSCGETRDANPYIVMEYVEGGTFAQWVVEHGSAEKRQSVVEQQGVRWLIDACHGCQAAHDSGMLHRDIKPANILIDAVNGNAKLSDFGLVRLEKDLTVSLTGAAEMLGTPAFMSPEQAAQDPSVDVRSDVYSLGACLYYCLTGQSPYQGSPLGVLKQLELRDPIRPQQLVKGVSTDLETICLKAMSRSPRLRYPSVSDLSADLSRFLEGRPITARRNSSFVIARQWVMRNPVVSTVTSLLILSLIAGLAVSTTMWLESEKNSALADSRNNLLIKSEAALLEKQTLLQVHQSQLRQSIQKMARQNVASPTEFSQQQILIRNDSLVELVSAYQVLFETGRDSPEQLREIVSEVVRATEIASKFGMATRIKELTELSHEVAQQWQSVGEIERCEDLVVLAELHCQRGDAKRHDRQWAEAIEAYREADRWARSAKAAANLAANDGGEFDATTHSLIAQTGVAIAEISSGQKETGLVTLNRLLKDLDQLESKVGVHLITLNARKKILLALARNSDPSAKVSYREQRNLAIKNEIELRKSLGRESLWTQRELAVGEIYLGLANLQVGKPAEAQAYLKTGIQQLQELIGVLPNNLQFRLDQVESMMLLADVQWRTGARGQAMKTQAEAIDAAEQRVALDPLDFAPRRRLSSAIRDYGLKLRTQGRHQEAADAFLSGARHIRTLRSQWRQQQMSSRLLNSDETVAENDDLVYRDLLGESIKSFERVGNTEKASELKSQLEQ